MLYTDMTRLAMNVAYHAHQGQTDKAGLPYILHPLHIAEQMDNEEATATALLHDVAEDTEITLAQLAAYGFPQQVMEALTLLTHDKDVPYMDYIRNLADHRLARQVKLADLRHNMDESRLSQSDPAAVRYRAQKYTPALALLEAKEAADTAVDAPPVAAPASPLPQGRLRLARPEDARALLDIYRESIDSPVTFEEALPTEEEFCRRIQDVSSRYPYLVAEDEAGVAGYAYAHAHQQRAAYGWSAEASIYIRRNRLGQGWGMRLYTALFHLLALEGVQTVYAAVVTPNPASEGLHHRLGFQTVGFWRRVGYKAGAWQDVVWLEKSLGDYPQPPQPLTPFPELNPQTVQAILENRQEENK